MIENVSLEVSLKPFWDLSDAGIRRVCETIFLQWRPLIKDVERVSVMFWAADGSEILDYRGRLEDRFEWAKYIGVANPEVYGNVPDLPQEQLSIHHSPRLYRENPPEYTYGDLKRILEILRAVFAENGRQVRLGTTFDPGPEFAKSSFKYDRHKEVCMADTLGQGGLKSFVCCYAEVAADSAAYAGFPDGIAAGTPFGKFLGRQTRCFCADLGFDYIWLSNGFGFGLETWGVCGAVFDGETFDNAACEDIQSKIFRFWTEFRKELPDLPIETRGTNLSTGMDLASDAVPLREIYAKVPGVTPPPNSPWAALNGDFGMELAGWMSHIAELPPGTGYPFRYYIHDPWFINSPWLDRYARNPHDIYMPMAITRLDETGSAMGPCSVNFLSIDNSYGAMPDQVPSEVIPHIKAAMECSPDAAGPVVWLYPFEEYHEMTFAGEAINEVFFGDWFMRSAINTGFQVNSVVSTANFAAALRSGACAGTVIATPTAVTRNQAAFERLKQFIAEGGKALFYGPVENDELANLLGLALAEAIDGELDAVIDGNPARIKHDARYSAGGINTVQAAEAVEVLATVSNADQQRVLALSRNHVEGQVAWVRGSNSFWIKPNGRYPEMYERNRYFYPETLMRTLLGRFGYVCEFEKYAPAQADPVIVTHYHSNALYISMYVPEMNTAERLKFPEGAPVFVQTETLIENGLARYHFPKAEHLECRVFVEMGDGAVKCVETCLATPEVERRLTVQGLQDATVRFRPETGCEARTRVLLNPGNAPFLKGEFLEPEHEDGFAGTVLTYRHVSGQILISW
jgi:hypothetical protein